jgi:hypothetical protein
MGTHATFRAAQHMRSGHIGETVERASDSDHYSRVELITTEYSRALITTNSVGTPPSAAATRLHVNAT